jgi:hypothetical protein
MIHSKSLLNILAILSIFMTSSCANYDHHSKHDHSKHHHSKHHHNTLSAQEKKIFDKAVQKTLSTVANGQSIKWQNPHNSHDHVVITPMKSFKNHHGQYCREYKKEFMIHNKKVKEISVACLKKETHHWYDEKHDAKKHDETKQK